MFVSKLVIRLWFFIVLTKVGSTSSYPWLEQITRQEVLQSGCNKLEFNSVDYSRLDHILVDHKHKFLYCYVPKVACTNWKRVFMVLTERSNATDLASIPGNLVHANGSLLKFPELDEGSARQSLTNYTSFVMVRHPFERLLSAYRNKLEGNKPSAKYFQARIGKYIVKKYRENPTPADLKNGDNVSFREFVQYLIDDDFSSDNSNEHWKPIFQLCHPCSLNYTFIGKYDKFEEDAKIILKMIQAPPITFPHPKTSQTAEILKYYFMQLSLDDIEKLYRKYQLDFKLFGYNLEHILGFDIG